MAAQIAALGEHLLAEVTLVRPRHRVLPEVVPQVAALSEDRLTILVLASEVKLDTLGLLIEHFNRLVPVRRDAREVFDVGICLARHNLRLPRRRVIFFVRFTGRLNFDRRWILRAEGGTHHLFRVFVFSALGLLGLVPRGCNLLKLGNKLG